MNLILTVTGKRMVVWVQSGSGLLTGRGPEDAQRDRTGAWLASLENSRFQRQVWFLLGPFYTIESQRTVSSTILSWHHQY